MDMVITEDRLWIIGNCAVISAISKQCDHTTPLSHMSSNTIALWIADFIATLPTEINEIWRRKLTGAAVLFLINRYSLLFSVIVQISLSLPGNETNEQCKVTFNIVGALQVLATATTNVLFALRVYAIYNKNRIILGTCCILIISRLVIDILQQTISQGISSAGTQFQSFSACLLASNSNLGIQCGLDSLYVKFLFNSAIVNFIIPFLALGYDIYIFGLTMRKTIDLGFKMKRQGQSSVAHVIIQDGILYFLVVLVSAVIEAILTGITLKDQIENPSHAKFAYLAHTWNWGYSYSGANLSSLHFASNQMLGNIGAPLDGGSFSEEEEELNEVEIELENIS
ncbi:hypothetical protein DFJ43DRAFT_1139063 [Lentinula guzmanii]|uniref:DUF6533 domain-containing protein n=1 Tax=Lentinula guzmanii TaxID=2804957 RepID=A0AA38J8W9_9AGAR|nr:hypothetical protein DFJ43DRAFT_1139063 [Lentinula guzmanii]